MQSISLGSVLKSALLAGLLGALVSAAFHAVVTEPVIDKAIALEEQMAHPTEEAAAVEEAAPMVSRDLQRVGLWLGLVIYGLSWSLLLGSVFFLAQDRLPEGGPSQRGMIFVALAYWAIALLPFLKYPANPPGVGEPETIGLRQNLYFGLMAAGIVGAGLTLALQRILSRRLTGAQPWLGAVGFLAVYSLVFYLVLPANPDPIRIPADLLNSFRTFSIIGLSLFWVAFGAGFGWLLRRAVQAQEQAAQLLKARPRGSQA